MAVNFLSNLVEYSTNVYVLTALVTVIVISVSTTCLLRNLFCTRADSTSKDEKANTDEISSFNEVGNDGDNKAECDKTQTSTSHLLSPRYSDPVEYCEHIQGEFKRVQQSVATRTIEKTLTEQQLEEEREVQRKQLGEIFKLMQEQQERFGIGSMDDMQEQMKLYAL